MTNIYNKKVLVRNGTLISNWYEEQVLKESTGETRSIPKTHIPKKYLDFDTDFGQKKPQDDTKTRILGTKLEAEMIPTNREYGNFPKKKYEHLAIKDKIFLDFFKSYLNQGKIDHPIKNNVYSSEKNQPLTFSSLNQTNKVNFVDPNIDKFVPFYNTKESKFWENKLQKTNPEMNSIHNLKETMLGINEKILTICKKKGWLSFRNLRNFIKNTFKKDKIPKFNLKFYLSNYGIYLNEIEINCIYSIYDERNKDEIQWNKFFDDLIIVNDSRNQLIRLLINQITVNNETIKDIEKIFSPQDHPDVKLMRKSCSELKTEFFSALSTLMGSNGISVINMEALLRDICYSLESDDEFIQVLISCGLNY